MIFERSLSSIRVKSQKKCVLKNNHSPNMNIKFKPRKSYISFSSYVIFKNENMNFKKKYIKNLELWMNR